MANRALRARIDEQAALRAVGRAAVDNVPVPVFLARVVDALALAFPGESIVTAELDGQVAVRPEGGERESPVVVRSPVVSNDVAHGWVALGGPRPLPFPREAQRLLDSVAETITAWLERKEGADLLRASEARSREQATALGSVANAVIITDPDGTIRWVNEAFTTMSGYTVEDAVGSTPHLLSSDVQDEAFYRHLWDTVLAGETWRDRMVNRHADGHLYHVNQTITPLTDSTGAVEQLVTIQDDVTAEVEAALEAAAASSWLRALFDTALDAIVLADDDGYYVEVNPAAEILTGYTRDELLHMRPSDLTDTDPPDVDEQFQEFTQAGQGEGSFRLRRKDGRILTTEYRAVADIQPGMHLSILRDVTDRNRTLQRLRGSEARFRQLAENASDIVAQVRFDPGTGMHVDYANPASSEILGYPLERFYTEPELFFGLFENTEDLTQALAQLPTVESTARSATLHIQRQDQTWVWLDVSANLSDPGTTPLTVQIVARDITHRHDVQEALEEALRDQRQAAQELQLLHSLKDTFLQSVSHEIRTPVTSIVGFSELLTRSDHRLSVEQVAAFHVRIRQNAQPPGRVVNDMLNLDPFTRGSLMPLVPSRTWPS